jgi:hypothetical protein
MDDARMPRLIATDIPRLQASSRFASSASVYSERRAGASGAIACQPRRLG